jgi:carbamoyltransferase
VRGRNRSLAIQAPLMTAILGISAFYHDSAAALVVDGEIVAAAQEERFTRRKQDDRFPELAIAYCLKQAGLTASDLTYVGYYEKPLQKFDRLLETYLSYVPRGFQSFKQAIPIWLKQKLYLPREIKRGLRDDLDRRYVYVEHHQSHAASAFFPSPFEQAAILTLDGVGEWSTAAFGTGRGHEIQLTHQMRFPHSLGMLYSAFTYYTGFTVNSGEYKVMGLAPYGQPRFVDVILERLIDLKEDGSFRMDMSYFNYCAGLTMTSKKFEDLFGGPPRKPDTALTALQMDLAASIQRVTEEIMLRTARHVHAATGMKNLCLAGGVALNCVGNARILQDGPFENIWIQPAAGDAGGALGTALFIWHQLLRKPRQPVPADSQRGSYLGPAFTDDEAQAFLDATGAPYTRVATDAELCDQIADAIADGHVVGWFQGRMEFGPRALGARSLLGDPRRAEMQTVMNMKVKFREGFRPFAPSVLREHVSEYFDAEPDVDSPYMLLVFPVAAGTRRALDADAQHVEGIDKLKVQRSTIPAVTHVDFSARLQTIDAGRFPLYHQLISAFYEKTGCPVVVNTSFNLGWDPIVCTPRDAFDTFMCSDIDVLAMGRCIIRKSAQPAWVGESLSTSPGTGVAPGVCDPVLDPLWSSPCCQAPISRPGGSIVSCSRCGHVYPIDGGIPLMFAPHAGFGTGGDVTEEVKSFYEETPFPNYDDHDSVRSLIEKSRRGVYAKMLNDAIPFNTTVLEVGCGTGQLSNFLGIGCRRVIGTDLCLNSLRLGEAFRREHALSRVRFVQMNLFRPCFKPGQFDVVLCNGVLHHTSDPAGGFKSLVPLVRPGGYIIIGLYNTYGRLATDLRRTVFRLTGGRGSWLDPYLRTGLGPEKRRAWFADQYQHPHESKHTIGEVLEWFDEAGLTFVRGIPSVSAAGGTIGQTALFEREPRGSRTDHFVSQASQVFTGNREGGFFLMIARRPAPEEPQRT